MVTNTELSRWNSFRELERLQDEMKSLFMRSRTGECPLRIPPALADWSPTIDITEDDGEFTITAHWPDVKKEDVKVTLDDRLLTIRGENEPEQKTRINGFDRIERTNGTEQSNGTERTNGKHVRTFHLPEEIEGEKISARFENGVLTVHLPKGVKPRTPTKEIAIQ